MGQTDKDETKFTETLPNIKSPSPIDELTKNMAAVGIGAETTTDAVVMTDEFMLSEYNNDWLQSMRCDWFQMRNNMRRAKDIIAQFLQNNTKPLLLALHLFANCLEPKRKPGKKLSVCILDTACNLSKTNDAVAKTLDDETRYLAFHLTKFASKIGVRHQEIVIGYDLYKISNELIPQITALCNTEHYRDAAFWIIYLKLSMHFVMQDILLPLVLQERFESLELYLDSEIEQQRPLLEKLDRLVDSRVSVCRNYKIMMGKQLHIQKKNDGATKKNISKILVRLAKRYNVNLKTLPHLHHRKATSYLSYLCGMYKREEICGEAWSELIIDTSDSAELQSTLVRIMQSFLPFHEVLSWAKYFQLPLGLYSNRIRRYLREDYSRRPEYPIISNTSDSITNSPTYKDKYLTLPISTENIIWIENKQDFNSMLHYLERQALIAWDIEWKPIYLIENPVALMQLATYERIYLIDCKSTKLDADTWKSLGRNIFNNKKIRKIAFALHNDMIMLENSLPLGLKFNFRKSQLDVLDLSKSLKRYPLGAFPYGSLCKCGESLSNLVEIISGKKLNKTNQVSNWAKRPLRASQLTYAALDAYCLLIIYDVFLRIMKESNLYLDINGEICLENNPKNAIESTESTQLSTVDVNVEGASNGGGDGGDNTAMIIDDDNTTAAFVK